MPATRRDSFRYQGTVAIRIGRVFPLMPRLITKETGRSDVAFLVLAPVLPGDQVLGGALKPSGLGGRQSVLRGKCQRIRRPHGEVAVEAKAILATKRGKTELGQGWHKRFHIKTMKPARP